MKKQRHLTPSELVIKRFKNALQLSKLIGVHPANVYRWTERLDNFGNRGLVPDEYQRIVLRLAEKKGIPLTCEEIIYGGIEA